MSVPTSTMAECPVCRGETLHEVLSGKMEGKTHAVMDSTVKCRECGHVHHIVVKVERPLDVPIIISWIGESVKTKITIGPDEVISVDDEIMCGEKPVLVTSIESKGARVKRAKARDIQTIWAKKFDKIRVPFSIGHLGRSYSESVLAVPDEEFFVGDILKVGKAEVAIHTIKLRNKVVRDGGAEARDIVRVYAAAVKKKSY